MYTASWFWFMSYLQMYAEFSFNASSQLINTYILYTYIILGPAVCSSFLRPMALGDQKLISIQIVLYII